MGLLGKLFSKPNAPVMAQSPSLPPKTHKQILVKGKPKDWKFEVGKPDVWVDPDKLDFDGKVLSISESGIYHFAEGDFSKAGDVVHGVMLFTLDEVLYYKEAEDVGKGIVADDGTAIFYSEENVLYILQPDGKQKTKKAIGVDPCNDSLGFDICYFVDTNNSGDFELTTIEMETYRIKKTVIKSPHNSFLSSTCHREDKRICLEFDELPTLYHDLD